MERKSSKEYSIAFWWKAKSSSYEICLRGVIVVVFCAANSIGTPLEFAAFGSGPGANIERLVHSGFFCLQPWFCDSPNTFSQEKYLCVYLDRPANGKQLSKY